jgi:Protein of unknown function (DUF732)
MVAQKHYDRCSGVAVISGALLFAGIICAPPARADANSYLSDMRDAGIRDEGGDAALFQTGRKLCTQVSYGASPRQLLALAVQHSEAGHGANGLRPQKADALVNYAIADPCPNYH